MLASVLAIFRVAANANHKVDRHGMTRLLRDCIQIPKQLGEVAAFGGSNVEPSVQSCFEKVVVLRNCCYFTMFLFRQQWAAAGFQYCHDFWLGVMTSNIGILAVVASSLKSSQKF
jgi:EF-hand